MTKRKWRFGDRSDGYRIRSLCPMNKVSPYIMRMRCDSQNLIALSSDVTIVENYISKKRAEGLKGFGYLHFFIACYVRAVSQRPGINRFIAGQKIYSRNNIEIILTLKKKIALNYPETVIKCEFEPGATAKDIYEKMNENIETNKTDRESSFDNTAKALNYIPGIVLRFAVGFLNFLDYFGLLPRFLTKISPFHGSLVITSMGSLGIPAIYHHLYNFGNVPIFCSFGAKYTKNILEKDGTVSERKFIDYTFSTDERICDGHYFASTLKYINSFMKTPEVLDNPPEIIIYDID